MPASLNILVADDHEVVLRGTIDLLRSRYPEAEIKTAQCVEEVLRQVQQSQPDLVVLDLALPQKLGEGSQPETGLQLVKKLMQDYTTLNIMVQSTHIKTLIRIRPEIDSHHAGFTIAEKSLASEEMLKRVNWALEGATHTKDISSSNGLELKPIWLEVLRLAFHEGLTDWAISKQLNVSERSVRNYWTKIYDVLEIYPEDDRNTRIQTEKRARETGLID